jgi:hypothetical protein
VAVGAYKWRNLTLLVGNESPGRYVESADFFATIHADRKLSRKQFTDTWTDTIQ